MAASSSSKHLLGIFIFLVALVASCHGAPTNVVWVAPNGNDTTGAGTEQAPYATIEHAFSLFPDNVRINLVAGTWNATIPASATNVAIYGEPTATFHQLTYNQAAGGSEFALYLDHLEFNFLAWYSPSALQLAGHIHNVTMYECSFQARELSPMTPINPIVSIVTQTNVAGALLSLNRVASYSAQMPAVLNYEGFGELDTMASSWSGVWSSINFKSIARITHTQTWFQFSTRSTISYSSIGSVRHLSNSAPCRLNTARVVLDSVLMSFFNSTLIQNTAIQYGASTNKPCTTMPELLQMTGNTISNFDFTYSLTANNNAQCDSNFYRVNIITNAFDGTFAVHTPINLNFEGNYWHSASGPQICSNPGGTGITIPFGVDYAYWCTNAQCTSLNNWPRLPSQLITGPCRSLSPSSIIIFIIVFFVLLAVVALNLFLYCLRCHPLRTDEEFIIYHYSKVTSVMTSLLALLIIILAIVGLIGSAACPTRVSVTSCPFTLTDRAVAANGLLLGCLMGAIPVVTLLLLVYRMTEQRPLLYTSMGFQLATGILGLVLVIVSLNNLSQSTRGPFMHLIAVPAAGYSAFTIIVLYHLDKLRKYCRHTIVVIDVADYKTENQALLHKGTVLSREPIPSSSTLGRSAGSEASESDASVVSMTDDESGDSIKSDQYAVRMIPPIQVFYSDYQKITQRYIFFEACAYGALIAFAIWYTISSYKAAGAILLTLILLEAARLTVASFISEHRGPLLGFKLFLYLSLGIKIAFLAITIFLFVQVFTLTSHASAYLTASFFGPALYLGCITTIRGWKMYEAVREKNAKIGL